MTTLRTLPLEILTEILSSLSCNDLTQTARVSQKLHAVSQSLLYTAPCVRSFCGFSTPPSTRIQLRPDPPSLQLFLRTLLSPGGEEIAAQVRSLRLEWDTIPADRPRHLPSNVAGIFAAAASRIGLRQCLAFQNVQVVLLLHILPQLRILDLRLPSSCDPANHPTGRDLARPPTRARLLHLYQLQNFRCSLPSSHDSVKHFIGRDLARPPTGARPLPLYQLQEFRCSPGEKEGPIDPEILLILIGMPNMRILDVQIIDSFHYPLVSPTRTSGVTKLCLRRAVVSPWSLGVILSTTVALTHFSYFMKSYRPVLDITYIGPALAPLRGTLQLLHITIDGGGFSSGVRANVIGTIGSFRDWPCLRTLRCPLLLLLGRGGCIDTPRLVDILPVGLRELEILRDESWDEEKQIQQVLPVLRLKKTVAPVLERLSMALWRGVVDNSELEELRCACNEAAVLLIDRMPRG